MHISRNKFVIAAIAACAPLSSVSAGGLGVSVNIGGISADVSVGRGSIASADVGIGGSDDDRTVSAGVEIGGSGGSSGGGSGGGSGGSSGGGSGGGSGDGSGDDTSGTGAVARIDQNFQGAPRADMSSDIIGTTVWTRDEVLVGIVTDVRPGPNDDLMLSVEIVDGFGIVQDIVIFQIGLQTVTAGRLQLSMMRDELIARLA